MHQDYSEKELEKLLEIAESEPQKETVQRDTDVEKFIKKLDIQDGELFVPNYVLYYTYYHSRKSKTNYTIPKASFLKRFSKYFKSSMKSRERGYYLNEGPFDVSLEGKFKARALIRKQRNAKKGKEKKES